MAVHRDGAKTLRVVEGTELVVGRAYPADMVIADPSLSRTHARVHVSRLELRVEDLGSTNGTWLDGRRVAQARVRAGEPVRLGDVTLVLQSTVAAVPGIDGYDRFAGWLEQEIVRAKTFGRPLALLSVGARQQVKGTSTMGAQVSAWSRITALLRPVDRTGLYSSAEILVGLPETPRPAAEGLAARIQAENPSMRVNLTVFPEDGVTLEELLANARDGRRGGAAPVPARIVESEEMRRVRSEVTRVAASVLPILILGETGVGKELLAREVHEKSPRKAGPFFAFNCASVPPTLVESVLFGHERGAFTGADKTTRGVFELAHGGTLFLDEVGELGLPTQAALLRVLETKRFTKVGSEREIEVDVRIVAATHRDLESMVGSGQFRQDLLFRLETVAVRVPPLRARTSEIAGLAHLFLEEANATNGRSILGFTEEAGAALQRHGWPGNVRELKNAVFRAAVIASGDRIELVDLPERVRKSSPAPAEEPISGSMPPPGADASPGGDPNLAYKERVRVEMQRYETALILDALRRHDGNQTAAAAALKIPVRTLAHKMKELGIKKGF